MWSLYGEEGQGQQDSGGEGRPGLLEMARSGAAPGHEVAEGWLLSSPWPLLRIIAPLRVLPLTKSYVILQ